MQKNIKIISLFFILIFLFCGCATQDTNNEKYMAELAEYENEVVKEVSKIWHPDIEEMKAVEEDKSLLEEKEEFMQLFKKFCGFSLPEYFIIPKVPSVPDWRSVYIDERNIQVTTCFIVQNNDALKMLEHLRKDDSWAAFGGKYELRILTQKAREKCTIFKKSKIFNETIEDYCAVFLDFLYDKDNDFYIVNMIASLERDPPPGTSWPEIYYH